MKRQPSEDEKAQFRGDETAALEKPPPPSAGASPASRRKARRIWHGIAWLAVVIVVFVATLGVAVHWIGEGAIGNERLRHHAERAITRLVGFNVDVSIGEVEFGLGTSSLLALELHDVKVARRDSGAAIVAAERLRFGLRALPLIRGELEFARLELEGATILTGLASFGPKVGELGSPISPNNASKAVFGAAERVFTATENLHNIRLSNVRLVMDEDQGAKEFVIERMDLWHPGGKVALEGVGELGNRHLNIDGTVERNAQTGTIETLSLDFVTPGSETETWTNGALRSLGNVEVSLRGHQALEADETTIALDAKLGNIQLAIDDNELRIDQIDARIAFRQTSDAFSVIASPIAVGSSVVSLQGTIGARNDREPGYRFDLVSRDSIVEPAESPEPALPFAMRLSGFYNIETRRLSANEINLRTSGGEMMASAAVTLSSGQSPGIRLAVYVDDMPTAHAKQFWPWFAARGARNWALLHVFGGRVYDSSLHLSVPPGRLGNGVPLSRDELGGRFNLADTRFDIAGNMPPVRDGEGWVAFRGTDVQVGLSAGTIYMPGMRRVDVGAGSLAINAAHMKPRIGQLQIDVAGDASAIAELASYKPISASRFHDFAPGELSGETSGHIEADIPLQADIPAADLNWRVNLDYENLSIAKTVDGQEVTDANGSLLVQPDRAEFTARADLNAVPATLHIVEPLGGSRVERIRNVELHLDDASRGRLLPGLNQLVSGPFTVTYDELPGGKKKIEVSLQTARLTIPWIGWEKPTGLPATAEFLMQQDESVVELTDFTLKGDELFVGGAIRLVSGRLQEADLDRVQLSENDNFSAIILATGPNAYSVSVDGTSFDARPVIKELFDGGESGSPTGASDSVLLDAKLDRAIGFNGKALEQVELSASFDNGATRLSGKAAAPRYGSVSFERRQENERTTVQASSNNAGAILSFLDIYKHAEDGQISVSVAGPGDTLSGQVDMRDFWVVDEPKLEFLVASSARESRNGQKVDTSRVFFDTGSATITKEQGSLKIKDGVLRGSQMGSTFQGTLYDTGGNIALTGTFMPLYGINRVFGAIPIIGQILGNGRDQGLIGITYRLSGRFNEPTLNVNPISAIAPGVFRQIFEYQ